MENITLKVDPQVLLAKEGELTNEKTTIMSLMSETESEMKSLVGVWVSDASTEFQNRFSQVHDDIENVFAILSEHISDLNESANIYTTAESAAKNVAEGLPTDGVFRV